MNRTLAVAGGILGGAAMLTVGIVVGTQVGKGDALVAAADAQGPLSTSDTILLSNFITDTQAFDNLTNKARKGKQVGDQMIRTAVAVHYVEKKAQSPELHDAAAAVSDAMMTMGASIITNDAGTAQEGVAAYKAAQDKIVALTNKINENAGGLAPSTQPVPQDGASPTAGQSPAGSPSNAPSGATNRLEK